VLGAAGLGLSLVGSASASTLPTADIAQSDKTSHNQRFVLGEEEMADVQSRHVPSLRSGKRWHTGRAASARMWLRRVPRLRRLRVRWWDRWRVSCLRGLRGLRRLLRIVGHVPLVLNLTTFRRSRDGPSEGVAAMRRW